MSRQTTIDLESAFRLAWEAVEADSTKGYEDFRAQVQSHIQEEPCPGSRPRGRSRIQRPKPIYQPRVVAVRRPSTGAPRLTFNNSILPSRLDSRVRIPRQAHCSGQAQSVDKYWSFVTTFPRPASSASSLLNEKRVSAASYSLGPAEELEDRFATAEDVDRLTAAYPIPQPDFRARWSAWRYMSYYLRLWTFILLVNAFTIAGMAIRAVKRPGAFTYGSAATAVGANLFIATLARHEHFINLMFRTVCLLPVSTPLWIRRRAAQVYSYGGIHSGCGLAAMLWYIFYAVLATFQFRGTSGEKTALAVTTTLTILLLILITGMAHPHVRRRFHNQWEISHRFGGWLIILLVWAQTVIITVARSRSSSIITATTLSNTPTFYFLLIISLLIIYPWLRLRRRTIVCVEPLSSHAMRLHFNDRRVSHCIGYRLATNPLLETHGFATIPNAAAKSFLDPSNSDLELGKQGYSILLSTAGDWTSHQISHPPKHIWTKGHPTFGLMRIASLFSPLVILATGSGIGPALSFLQAKPGWAVRVIWSARSPMKTYGSTIVESVFRADKGAVVVDTGITGHPRDLAGLCWAVMQDGVGSRRGEAVVVVSNPKVTKMVVEGLEGRGVPAYGALFDS